MTQATDRVPAIADPKSVVRSLLAVLPPLVALLVELALRAFFRPSVWFLFYPAVFFSSWLGGLRAAIVATVIGAASALWLFVPPAGSFLVPPGEYIAAGVFLATGIAFGVFHDHLRRASGLASRALAESERVNEGLKRALEERRLFMALIENSSDFIGIADRQGIPMYVNPAGRRMVGLPADLPVERTRIPEYYPPEHRAFASDVIVKSTLQSGHWQGYTWLRHWQTEEAIPVSDTHFMIRDPETGQPLGMGTVTRDISEVKRLEEALTQDITERVRLEEEVRKARERVELALQGADLATWDWNIETSEVVFSSRWAEMRGLRPEEVAPRVESWSSGVHPEDWPRVQQALKDYFEGGTPQFEAEYRVRTKSGRWMWILDRGKVFSRGERGQPIRMVGTELDNTARKRADDELRLLTEVGATFGATLDYDETLTTIAQLTVRDLADFCIVDMVVDNEVRRPTVVSRDPARAWICHSLMNIALDRARPHLTLEALQTRRPVLLECVSPEMLESWAQSEAHFRALRALDPKSLIMVPLSVHGKLLGAMVLVSSTPDRIYGDSDLPLAQELALRAALAIENARLYHEARQAIQTRDDVLGIVAHDLRNPLNNIVIQTSVLQRTVGGSADRARAAAESIQRAAQRLDRLIEDLLDVTSIDAGRLSIERRSLAAVDILRECVDAQRALAASAKIELGCDFPEPLPDVSGDHDRLLQALENLIGNAIKFTGPGGSVVAGAVPREGEVLFWVSDTGSGISSEDLPHVFDRFWRAGKPKQAGAGLGLAITKGIVEAHGGRIWVESTIARGTTIFFTIPRVPRPEHRPLEPMH